MNPLSYWFDLANRITNKVKARIIQNWKLLTSSIIYASSVASAWWLLNILFGLLGFTIGEILAFTLWVIIRFVYEDYCKWKKKVKT